MAYTAISKALWARGGVLSKPFIKLAAHSQELITASKEWRDLELGNVPDGQTDKETVPEEMIIKMVNFLDGWLLPNPL